MHPAVGRTCIDTAESALGCPRQLSESAVAPEERRRFSFFGSRPSRTVSVMVIDHAHDHDLLRHRGKHRARMLPCRITWEYIASSSLRAAGLTSFGPIAAKRLDDVRCHDAMTNKELNLEQCSGVFDPEELSVLGRLYDSAITALPPSMRSPENRTAIAKLILERTAAGEAQLACLTNLLITISPQG
ncbi:hypothetical protein [Bradyrhizobium niftali]|uniref:hypothetical protein n=2 Tax=Bradyrhizobium niftali TaxID=2560055 RepID=UPI001F44D541|nr:hypothetical protein [Bradyrhizobium niftali]